MPRDYKVYLEDILGAIERIESDTDGMNFEDFKANRTVRDVAYRNLEVLGEAVKNLPKEVKKEKPAIRWKELAGLRDVLIHQYFRIDLEIV